MDPSNANSPPLPSRGRGVNEGSRAVSSPSRFSLKPVSPPMSPSRSKATENSITSTGSGRNPMETSVTSIGSRNNPMESSVTSLGISGVLLEGETPDSSCPPSRADSMNIPLGRTESSPMPASMPQPGTNPKDSPILPRHVRSDPSHGHSLASIHSIEDPHTKYGSYGASVPINILQDDIRSSTNSIQNEYNPSPQHYGSYKATPPLSIPGSAPHKGLSEHLRRSRFDSLRSLFSTQHSVSSIGSHQRVNIVTEAAAVLPSLCSSAFSVERIEEASIINIPVEINGTLDRMAPPSTKTASCHDNLDVLEDPNYTDTVKSTDSNSSLLKRSMSVPSQYHYKPSARRPHAKEVFEDFITRESPTPHEEDDIVTDLPQSNNGYPKKKWRQTMDDLYENPEYMDSVQSTSSGAALLARTAVSISKGGKHIFTRLAQVIEPPKETPQKYVKNLIILSLSFMLVFTAYLSLRNLQSSINQQGGLALFALASVYAFLFLGCIFATTIVQRLRPKVTMLLCMISLLLYVIANFYPHYYTLVPSSIFVGFSLSNMWTAHATYLTNIAASYAELTGKSIANVIGKFNGIFFMFFGISQVLGGVISSTVLMSGSTPTVEKNDNYGAMNHNMSNNASHMLFSMLSSSLETTDDYDDSFEWTTASDLTTVPSSVNTTKHQYVGYDHCGAGYSYTMNISTPAMYMSNSQLYLLLGIFAGCTIFGMMIMLLFMDRLEGVMKKSHATLWDQMTAVFRWFIDWRVACLLCMMFYTLVEMSFMFGEFTTAFVTCPLGVHMVGYAMLCLSAASSVSSYLNGILLKHLGRMPLFISAGALHLGLMIVMLVWVPSPDTLYVMFIVTGLWGFADGVWFTQIISLLGVLFSHNKEPAFAGLKMCQALGACISFVTAKYIPTSVKLYLMMILLVFAVIGYIILEVRLKCIKQLAKKETANETTPV